RRAEAAAAIGFVSVVIPALLLFAVGRFAIDFFRGSLEVVRMGRVFISGPIDIDCLRSLSAIAVQLANSRCLSPLLWVIAVVVTMVRSRKVGSNIATYRAPAAL